MLSSKHIWFLCNSNTTYRCGVKKKILQTKTKTQPTNITKKIITTTTKEIKRRKVLQTVGLLHVYNIFIAIECYWQYKRMNLSICLIDCNGFFFTLKLILPFSFFSVILIFVLDVNFAAVVWLWCIIDKFCSFPFDPYFVPKCELHMELFLVYLTCV